MMGCEIPQYEIYVYEGLLDSIIVIIYFVIYFVSKLVTFES